MHVATALQRGHRREHPQLADAVQGSGQRGGRVGNQNGNFPAPQDINNLDADYGPSAYHQPYNSTTSFVWSLPFGKGKRWGGNMSSAMDWLVCGWQLAGINTVTPGEMVTLVYSAAPAFQVSGIHERFLGREQLPAQHHVRSICGGRPAIDHELVQYGMRIDSDRSEPAVRQRAAQQRPGTELLAVRSRGQQERRSRRPRKAPVPPRGVQPVQSRQLPGARQQPQRRHIRHDHDDL